MPNYITVVNKVAGFSDRETIMQEDLESYNEALPSSDQFSRKEMSLIFDEAKLWYSESGTFDENGLYSNFACILFLFVI